MDDMRIWEEQGKFVVQSLKDLGLGKTKTERHIQVSDSQSISMLSLKIHKNRFKNFHKTFKTKLKHQVFNIYLSNFLESP